MAKKQKKTAVEKAGFVAPSMKLEGEALQRHLGNRSATFAHRNSKRLKTRAARKHRALADY